MKQDNSVNLDIPTLIAIGTVVASLAGAIGALLKAIFDSWSLRTKTKVELSKLPIDINIASISAATSLTTQMSSLLQQSLIEGKTLREEVSRLSLLNSKKDIALIRGSSMIEAITEEHNVHNKTENLQCSYYIVVVAKLADVQKVLNKAVNGITQL